ncbi:MAG: hypothetical protein ACRD0U_16920, partial [Acidimicrobiales bacterium]
MVRKLTSRLARATLTVALAAGLLTVTPAAPAGAATPEGTVLNITGVKPLAGGQILAVTGRYSCGGSTQAQLGVFPNSLGARGSFLENVSCDVVD